MLRKLTGRAYEWQAVALLLFFQALVAAGTVALFFQT
jgi:hypothetical protein